MVCEHHQEPHLDKLFSSWEALNTIWRTHLDITLAVPVFCSIEYTCSDLIKKKNPQKKREKAKKTKIEKT